MKTNAQRSKEFSARKADQGLHEVRRLYAPKPLHAKIKAYAAKLARTKGGDK